MSAETRGMTLKEYCIRSRRAELLQQWHYAKNDGLTPDAVTCHSRQKVWWIDRLGHEWQQEIYSRTALCRGCPFCAGRKVLAGFNDLASTHPALSAQWDWEKNFDLTPQMVMAGNSRKVWWRCEKGHSWQATIASRASGCGCPVCANREIHAGENSLAARFPVLAAQWHPIKNGGLSPEQVIFIQVETAQCEQAYRKLREMFSAPDRPDGIFVVDGQVASPVYTLLSQCGLRIPEDVKVVSSIQSPSEGSLLQPGLTAYLVNSYKMGYNAAVKLIQMVQGGVPDENLTYVPYDFIERGSV